MTITGSAIRQMRGELRMTQPQFARLFGVHPMTVYRWEAQQDSPANLHPLHAEILLNLEDWLAEQNRRRQQEFGDEVLRGLAIGGTIAGLALLLGELATPERPKRRRKAKKKGRGTTKRSR